MPQLEFSIWLINLIYKWTFLCILLTNVYNYKTSPTVNKKNNGNSTQKNMKWTWT